MDAPEGSVRPPGVRGGLPPGRHGAVAGRAEEQLHLQPYAGPALQGPAHLPVLRRRRALLQGEPGCQPEPPRLTRRLGSIRERKDIFRAVCHNGAIRYLYLNS